MFFIFHYVPDQYKTQEMCGRVASKDPFIVYFPDKYITQKIHDEAFMIL